MDYSAERFAGFVDGYACGYRDGAQAELERREADDRRLYAEAVRIVHTLANVPTHEELQEIRRSGYARRADQ
ncbi:hypothetical protein GCM10027039_01720 [Terrabacter koreensis]